MNELTDTTSWKAGRLGEQRRKHLLNRISQIRRLTWDGDMPIIPPEPAAVKKARALVEAFDHDQHKARRRVGDEISEATSQAHTAVLFAEDAAAAWKIVDDLFAMARKRKWIR